MSLADLTFVPLVMKSGRPTCAAFVSSRADVAKALVLMMGSNQLPASQGLARLAGAFALRA